LISDNLYQKIIQIYQETDAVKETAKKLGTYPIKVRRVLITEGLWHSNTSVQICSLYASGLSVAEIAKQLFISEKNVQSYLPYSRGQYGGDNRSGEAVRSEGYRGRMKVAENSQIKKKNQISYNHLNPDKEMENNRMDKLDILKERTRQLAGERPIPYAIRLHLELNMEDKALGANKIGLLAQYGKMINYISRDIIVPGDITLHALHYVINRAFGWQNSHLHSFHPYEEDYNKMLKSGKLTEWAKLAGMYFRFPCEDYDDIYWDDDYETGISVKNWLRIKYTGPYYYGGTREYFYRCQQDIKELYEWQPTLEVRKSFTEWFDECRELEKKTGNKDAKADMTKRIAPITDVTVKELADSISFEGGFDELIERLPLYDILLMPGMAQNFELWDFSNKKILKTSEQDNMCLAPVTTPILNAIRYWYDYGDDWNVKITATVCYESKKKYEASGNPTEPIEEHRPICVEVDALPVCDDVGGIYGYCNMLEVLHGDDPEEKESMKNWARSMGWTGRKINPNNIL
jgi:DNA-binding CsgD family transcriptional regulator